VGWITPNLDELAILIDHAAITRETIPGAAHHLRGLAHMAGNEELSMVITGGHLDRPDDYFLGPSRNNREPALHNMDGKDEGLWIPGEAVKTTSTHGTGCAFSSALLAALLHGQEGMRAVVEAKQFVTGALRAAYPVGKGHGPMNHFYRQRPSQSLQV
jgi:hydroxymethylpyrimidine/phosphomethylpyrimidine kinase